MFRQFAVSEQVRRPVSRFSRMSKSTSISTGGIERRPIPASISFRACAWRVAREAIEYESTGGVVASEPVADHAKDNVVGHQLTGVHGGLGAEAQRRSRGHGLAQQVAGGELDGAVLGHQALRLCALAGARRAEKNDAQVDFPSVRDGGVSYRHPAVDVKRARERT